MSPIEKSSKLENVCYDIRGPVLKEAKRLEEEGNKVLKLNIGNPAPFGFKLLMVFLMIPMYKTERSVTGMESGNPFTLYCKVANLIPSFRRKRMQIKPKHLLKLKIIIAKVIRQISK